MTKTNEPVVAGALKVLILALYRGEISPESLPELHDALKANRQLRRNEVRCSVHPGSQVRVHGLVGRGAYMNGLTGEVRDVKRTRATVVLQGTPWRIPLTCLAAV